MDKTRAIYVFAESATAAASLIWWESIIASAIIALSYNIISKSKSKAKSNELLAFAKGFRAVCSGKGLNSALRYKSKDSNAPEELKLIERRLAAGDICPSEYNKSEDRNVNEFIDIIIAGLQSGTDPKNNLSLFISRLENEIYSRNKSIQSSLNMDTLSILGISFFVPLFGGIGTSIIAASGSIIGASTSVIAKSFQVILLIYIALMSYIMALFKESGKNDPAISAFQGVLIGAAIMKTAANFMIYAI